MSKFISNQGREVVSTADLAAKLGLSRWAVSRALNGRGGVGKATVARVRAAMEEHHFEPDLVARGLRGGPTGMVGVCLPQELLDSSRLDHEGLHPQAASAALSVLYSRLAKRGLNSITAVSSSGTQEAESLRRLVGLRVEAIVLVQPRFGSRLAEARHLLAGKTTCIAIDPAEDLPCTTLKFDLPQAARLAVNHLHQLGHKRLALLGMLPRGRKAQAFESACSTLGLAWRSQVRIMHLDDVPTVPTGSIAFGWALAETLLRKRAAATGLIAADDQIAAGALARFQHEGKNAPRDFTIIGYGNLEGGSFCNPPLTTIDPQAARLFERAADTLSEQLSAAGQIETQEILINPLFFKRGSTAPPSS